MNFLTKDKMKTLLITLFVLFFAGCTTSQELEVRYLKKGELCSEKIRLDFIKDGEIRSPYIDTVKFGILDSLSFPGNDPDHYKSYKTPVALDFSRKIKPYSPEYYAAYTVYNIDKVIAYYSRLFDDRIDFNSQTLYKTIELVFGDFPGLTHPNTYIFEQNSDPSPTLFFHEIGHRAFWFLENALDIKFKGLSVIHMGLLEYFTVSLGNSPVACEGDPLAARDASLLYKYPLDSTFNLRHTFKLLEQSCPEELKNPRSNIAKYLSASYTTYDDYILDNYFDNHRGGMVLTSTLWRIREQLGQEKTDRLVAQAILSLNDYLAKRPEFCLSKEIQPDEIEWCDVFYGLIQKDKYLFDGKDIRIIENEIMKTGYPVESVKY
jgi:hypothetical protein